MRKQLRHITILFTLATLSLSAAATGLGQTQPKHRRQAKSVVVRRAQAWEYKTTEAVDLETLNKLGAEGWELAAIYSSPGYVRLYFKRPKR